MAVSMGVDYTSGWSLLLQLEKFPSWSFSNLQQEMAAERQVFVSNDLIPWVEWHFSCERKHLWYRKQDLWAWKPEEKSLRHRFDRPGNCGPQVLETRG